MSFYVADSESGPNNNTTHPGGWQRGIRLGSAGVGGLPVTTVCVEVSVSDWAAILEADTCMLASSPRPKNGLPSNGASGTV
jgi:hypothetical protein